MFVLGPTQTCLSLSFPVCKVGMNAVQSTEVIGRIGEVIRVSGFALRHEKCVLLLRKLDGSSLTVCKSALWLIFSEESPILLGKFSSVFF